MLGLCQQKESNQRTCLCEENGGGWTKNDRNMTNLDQPWDLTRKHWLCPQIQELCGLNCLFCRKNRRFLPASSSARVALAAIPLHEMRFEKGLGQALHGVHGAHLQLESQDQQNQQISPDSCKFFKGQVPEFSECYSHGLKTVVDESHSKSFK